MSDPVAVALSVAQILEGCGLRYLVGGSLASSMSGEPRSTLDVDIVVALTATDVGPVADALRGEFDVDEQAVARAVRERSSVNVFHRASAINILLQKLRWFRKGNEVSDRQWRDVLGILLVQGDALDRTYLGERAERLGLSDLLARAETAVGRA